MAIMQGLMLLVLTILVYPIDARLPGFKARITKNGIAYVNTVAQQLLAKELKTVTIPDQSGDNDHVEWSLTNIQNRGFNAPSSSMALAPGQNGLTWALANLGLSLYADWSAEFHEGIIKISDSGSVDVNIKGVSLQVTIKVGDDGNGRPSVAMASCSADISDVDVDFHGGTAFILNLFKGFIGDKIRDAMKDQICQIIQKEINEDGAKAMSKLKVTVILLDKFVLDYGIIQAPNVLTNYLETEHKGEVYWINDMAEAPFSPKPFPPLTNVTKMMYLWLSEYVANSFAYVAQKHSFFQYNLTASELPPDNRSYLNTTCKLECIGNLIPQIGKAYPNSKVEMRGSSTSTPNVTITNTSISCDTKSEISMYAHTPDGKNHYLLTLAMNLSMSVQVAVKSEKVIGKILTHHFKVAVLKSALGKLDDTVLNLILGEALTLVVIPKLNEIGEKGVDLPVTDNLKFENTSVSLLNGSFVISTDLQYNDTLTMTSQPLKFESEKKYSVYIQN